MDSPAYRYIYVIQIVSKSWYVMSIMLYILLYLEMSASWQLVADVRAQKTTQKCKNWLKTKGKKYAYFCIYKIYVLSMMHSVCNVYVGVY